MSWLRTVGIASFAKFNPEWEIRIHRSMPESRNVGLGYAQQADWTWWRVLRKYGGMQVATDQVFLRPIPDEWLNYNMAGVLNGENRIYQFAVFGACPDHPWVAALDDAAKKMVEAKAPSLVGYQSLGVELMKDLHRGMLDNNIFFDIPMRATCPITWDQARLYWQPEPIEFGPEVVSAHWYGGDENSKVLEWSARPGHPYAIVKLAEAVFP